MPYCEKCGHKMSDDAVFCSKCGRKAVCIIEQKTKECVERKSVTEETTVSDKVVVADNENSEMSVHKKVNNKRLKLLLVIFLTVAIICFALFFVFRDNNKIITKNEDGKTVFAFTFSEFVDRYNENAPDKIFIYDFEKYDDEYELWEDDYSISVSIDKGNNPSYVTNVVLYHFGDNNEVPDEAVALLRALYPKMSEKQAYEDLEYLMIHGNSDFKNVVLFYENEDDYQYWNFHPWD